MVAQTGKIEESIRAALSLELNTSRFGHLRCDPLRGFVASQWCVQRSGFASDRQMQIDAVEQRPGELAAVALNLVWRTAAATAGVAQVAIVIPESCRPMDIPGGPENPRAFPILLHVHEHSGKSVDIRVGCVHA